MPLDGVELQVQRALGAEPRVLVGFSGGLDSTALLLAAHRAGVPIVAAHVDHGLRADSPLDATHCRQVCSELGVVLDVTSVRVPRGNSTQGRAREQRLAALAHAAARYGCSAIALAHHRDDAAETVLLKRDRLAGASASFGPHAEAIWNGTRLVRPLIGCSRDDLRSYVGALGLAWLDDPSNDCPSFSRVAVRQALRDGTRSLSLEQLEQARLDSEVARAAAEYLLHEARSDDGRWPERLVLQRRRLEAAPPEVTAAVLTRAAREVGGQLSRRVVDLVLAGLSGPARSRVNGSEVFIAVESDLVYFVATRGQGTRWLDGRRASPRTFSISRGSTIPWFAGTVELGLADGDLRLREGLRVELRAALPGDRLVASGMGGRRQRVASLIAAHAVPELDRWWWPVLCAGDRVLGVLGIRGAATDGDVILAPDDKRGISVAWRRFSP